MNQDELKRQVAKAAVDYALKKLKPSDVLGIGTGSTANHFIDLVAEHKDQFRGVVSSSEASSARAASFGIKVFELNEVDQFSIYVDGADESNDRLQLIKGGGAALTREKIVASCAREFVCIADESKWVETLGKFPVPVEVIPMARSAVARAIRELGGNPIFRKGVLTDNGCEILDVHGWNITDPKALEANLNQITGVVTNGLFAQRSADLLMLGTPDGVRIIYKPFG